MAAPVLPGLFFCLVAFALLIIASISTPLWDQVSFLDTSSKQNEIRFGVFGYTGSDYKLGYTIDSSVLDISFNTTDVDMFRGLTHALVLHPISAGLSGVAVILDLYGSIGALFTGLAMLCTLAAFVVDMSLWGLLRNRLVNAGVEASYGNANWIVLGAFAALVVGFGASTMKICGRFRLGRSKRADYWNMGWAKERTEASPRLHSTSI